MSAGVRDAFVQIEESLDFFESIRGSLKTLELLDVADQTLEVSLRSLEIALRPVALRNRLTTDVDDIRESFEPGRGALIWKFDGGREGSAASFNTEETLKLKEPKLTLFRCLHAIFRNRLNGCNRNYGCLSGGCRMARKPFKQVLAKKAIFIITVSKINLNQTIS